MYAFAVKSLCARRTVNKTEICFGRKLFVIPSEIPRAGSYTFRKYKPEACIRRKMFSYAIPFRTDFIVMSYAVPLCPATIHPTIV